MSESDAHLRERTIEKENAVNAIENVIAVIERSVREPDQWERVHIVRAFASLFVGAYSLARTEAALGLTTPNERSPYALLPSDSFLERCNVALLLKILAEARAEPVQPYPHFGPVASVR